MKKLILLLFIPIVFTCSSDDDNVTLSNDTEVTDVDGNLYPLQLIADEVWSTQNLRTKTYRDGSPIPYVEDPIEWANLTTGAWQYVNNDPTTEEKYGLFYNFYAVNNPKGLSPDGTRIPSYADFLHLTSYFGTPMNEVDGVTDGDKEIFLGFLTDDPDYPWVRDESTMIGTNLTGFNLYPAGWQRDGTGALNFFGYGSFLWLSDAFSPSSTNASVASWRFFSNTNFSNGTSAAQNYYGCSVRFIKN